MKRSTWLRGGGVIAVAGAALAAAGLGVQPVQQAEQPDRQMRQPAHAQDNPGHIMLNKDELEWKKGPPSLPEGAEFAVIEGDPTSSGPFTMRLRMPANYEIPAHTHPNIEHVTVISGTFHMGTGTQLDTTGGKELKPGGFALMAVGTRHYAYVGDEKTVVQLHGMGPWGIDYIDPSKDPRNNP